MPERKKTLLVLERPSLNSQFKSQREKNGGKKKVEKRKNKNNLRLVNDDNVSNPKELRIILIRKIKTSKGKDKKKKIPSQAPKLRSAN